MKYLVAVILLLLAFQVVANRIDVFLPQNPTIIIEPAEVRRLMMGCEGAFHISEREGVFRVRCVE